MVGDELWKCQNLQLAFKWQKNLGWKSKASPSTSQERKCSINTSALTKKRIGFGPTKSDSLRQLVYMPGKQGAALSNGLGRGRNKPEPLHAALRSRQRPFGRNLEEEKMLQAAWKTAFGSLLVALDWPLRYPVKASDGKNWWASRVCNYRGSSRRLTP